MRSRRRWWRPCSSTTSTLRPSASSRSAISPPGKNGVVSAPSMRRSGGFRAALRPARRNRRPSRWLLHAGARSSESDPGQPIAVAAKPFFIDGSARFRNPYHPGQFRTGFLYSLFANCECRSMACRYVFPLSTGNSAERHQRGAGELRIANPKSKGSNPALRNQATPA